MQKLPACKSKYPQCVGERRIVDGLLCWRDDVGRLYFQAPRKADVALALRLGAQLREMQDAGEIDALPPVTAVSVKDRKGSA
jgi:hypothetical protein